MLFNSIAFAIFLPAVLLAFHSLSSAKRRYLLLAASYFFYGWWDWRFCGLVAFSTVVDYLCALGIERSRVACPGAPSLAQYRLRDPRKLLLCLSLVANLALLGVFKYFDFFAASAQSLLHSFGVEAHLPTLEVLLPIGISFYTFQTMSYVIDVYRGLPAERNFIDFANFVIFFPQLVAGPIVRAGDLLPQLKSRHEGTGDDFAAGTMLIIRGLLKKVVLADNLSVFVDRVFFEPGEYASISCWFATYAYAFQIYLDFSGYTDIALGTARLFGVRLMENFNLPYVAVGPSDFWRRWHISLSTWIRDYLYIPLGGSRHGPGRTALALTLTMALGGLWHGARWNFVLWGLSHGVLLAGERLLRLVPSRDTIMAPHIRLVRALVTFHLVCLGWVLFRAPSVELAGAMFGRLFVWQDGLVVGRRFAVIVLFCALLHAGAFLWPKLSEYRLGPVFQGALAAAAAYAMIVMAPGTVPFVYFQF